MLTPPQYFLTHPNLLASLALCWGLLNLFHGYRLFRFFLAISGAFLGAQIAQQLFPEANPYLHLLLIILAVILTSLLAYSLYSLSFILLGSLTGLSFALLIARFLVLPLPLTLLTLLLGLLLGALFGSAVGDLIIILATAAGGTSLVLINFHSLFPQLSSPFSLSVIAWIILFLIGLLYQLHHYTPRPST